MDIIFYNQHQHGDIILSRQGVRWIVENSPKNINFHYLHNKHPKSIFVHENIKHISLENDFHDVPMLTMQKLFLDNTYFSDALWISSWIGSIVDMRYSIDKDGEPYPNDDGDCIISNEDFFDSLRNQQLLWKQNINLINQYLLLNFANCKIPYPSEIDLLVKWNSNPEKIEDVKKLLINDYKIRILICNGDTISYQRENFIYEDYLEDCFSMYNNVAFYLTENKRNIELPNVFYINDHIEQPNINEIEYLGSFCDIIVTSFSGPGTSVINDNTMFDPNKILIYVCRKQIGFHFDDGLCEYIHTDNYEANNIISVITYAIEKKINETNQHDKI